MLDQVQVLGDRWVSLIFHYPKRLTIKNKERYKEMRVDQNLKMINFTYDLRLQCPNES